MPEEIMVVAMMSMMCGTAVIVYALKLIFGNQGKSHEKKELREMRELLESQGHTMRQMQERLDNLETVVAGAEYEAGQRVSRALAQDSSFPKVSVSQHSTQPVRQLKETY